MECVEDAVLGVTREPSWELDVDGVREGAAGLRFGVGGKTPEGDRADPSISLMEDMGGAAADSARRRAR